jgi:glutamyl-tRNA reductase
MRLEAIGLNHRTSSLEVRDRAAMPPDRLRLALHRLMERDNLEGAVILSTCNRTELYLSPFQHTEEDELRRMLADLTGIAAEDAAAAYVLRDGECVAHLFRVAAGLDSRMLGEVQILGQLKAAYHAALERAPPTASSTRPSCARSRPANGSARRPRSAAARCPWPRPR